MLSETVVLLLTCTTSGWVDASLEQPAFRAEIGLGGELNAAQIDDRSIGPVMALYFDPVPTGHRPPDQAAFLEHASCAEIAIQLSTGAGQSVSDQTRDDSGWGLGWTGKLRWVGERLPISISAPFSSMRFSWRADGETLALVRYHTVGVEAGWFVRQDTEVALGFSYLQPDFFYKVGGVDYNYLAWDIYILNLRGQTALELPGGYWLALESVASLFIDQHDHKLWGMALHGSFYLSPSFGIGPRLSFSTFQGEEDAWSANLKLMGVTELGVQVALNLGTRWGLVAYVSHQIPAESEIDSRTQLGFDFRARW